ncbi:MAG: tetratricopeptide repeat protein, partial [Bacteroidota bacterium]|nr:tetratricopeptide repeat protein [Bacteroidota bacterium]
MKSFLLTAIFLLFNFTGLVYAQQPQSIKSGSPGQSFYQRALQLQQKGEYSNSLMLFEKASQQYTKDKEWIKKMESNNELTRILILMGKYKEASKKAHQILKESLTKLNGDASVTTGAYINLGNVFYEEGKFEKALAYFQRALRNQRHILGGSHPKIADTYISLGNVFFEKAKYDNALAYYQKALQIRSKIFKENHPDIATSYQAIGTIYINRRDSKKALEYEQKALSILLKELGQTHPKVADSYFYLGDACYIKGDYNKAWEYHQKAFLIRHSVFGESHPKVADSYNNLGKILLVKGKYPGALAHLKKAIEIRRTTLGETHPKLADAYNNLGKLHQAKGEYNKALELHQKALHGFLNSLGRMNPGVADSYKELGNTYFEKGEYDKALENFKQTLEIRRAVSGEAHTSVANSYYVFGKVYLAKGEYDKALEYFHKSLQIRLAAHGETQHNVADIYTKLGSIYQVKEEYSKALEYYQKALRIRQAVFGESHLKVADSYNNLGKVYYTKGDYLKALQYHQIALHNYQKVLGEAHPSVAESYNYIGNVYQAKGVLEEAFQYYTKALQNYLKTFGTSHPGVVESYNNLGNVYRLKGDLKKSLQQFQQAIIANVPAFEDSLISQNPILAKLGKPYLLPKALLFSLQAKATILEMLFNQSNTPNYLTMALQASCSADSVAYKIQQNYTEENDKVAFSASTMEFYQQALALCLKLHRVTNDKNYLDKAFYFAERGKANVLTALLAESKAKTFAGIPDSLLKLDQTFRSQIAQFTQLQTKELAKGKDADSSKLINYQNGLFTAHQKQESLLKKIEKKFPKFYALKYQLEAVTPKQLQGLLDTKTALLDYVLTDTLLQVFIISHKSYKVESIPLDSLFHQQLIAFRESILLKDPDLHQHVAYQLYKTLIPKSLPQSIKSLIIIPEGELTTLPFEALLTKPTEVLEIKDKPYLLKKYKVSYSYSARLLYEQLVQPTEVDTKQLLAMAPVFTGLPNNHQPANFQVSVYHQKQSVENGNVRVSGKNNSRSPFINPQIQNLSAKIKDNSSIKVRRTTAQESLTDVDAVDFTP